MLVSGRVLGATVSPPENLQEYQQEKRERDAWSLASEQTFLILFFFGGEVK